MWLSPSAQRIAAATDAGTYQSTTNIYLNGTLSAAAAGCAAGWLDESHMLVNTYTSWHLHPVFEKALIVDSQGLVTASPTLPEIRSFQNLGSNLVYVPSLNSILNAVTAETVWSTTTSALQDFPVGAVAADHVFFSSGSVIRAEPL
jgi:hypothetical protein